MPEEKPVHTYVKTFLWFLFVFVVGAALALAAAFFFFNTDQGGTIVRDWLVARAETPAPMSSAQAGQQTSGSSAATTASATTTAVILVPKSYANQDYFLAINNVVADISAINAANQTLGPLLNQLNQETLSCTFQGFYNTMSQALSLAQRNSVLAAQFSMHITALAAANTQTTDAITKSDTQSLVDSGQALGSSLQTYASAVQSLLTGDVPTAAELAQFTSQVSATSASSQTFANALQPLLQHLNQAVEEMQSATSSAQ